MPAEHSVAECEEIQRGKAKGVVFHRSPEKDEEKGEKEGGGKKKNLGNSRKSLQERRKILYIYWCASRGTMRELFGSSTKDCKEAFPFKRNKLNGGCFEKELKARCGKVAS